MLIADILMTTVGGSKARPELLERTLNSLFKNTNMNLCRFHIIQDGFCLPIQHIVNENIGCISHYIMSDAKEGLASSFNSAFEFLYQKNFYNNDKTVGDIGKVSQMFCYVQDDVIFEKGWLEKQFNLFTALENQHNLAMVSGIESVEHPIVKDLGGNLLLKNWVRMTQFMTRWQTIKEMLPIPILDPETGRKRGLPNNGLGSSCDWWICRNHEKSLVKSGRNCLVIKGQLAHSGYQSSTWLNRELPETEEDKRKINNESI